MNFSGRVTVELPGYMAGDLVEIAFDLAERYTNAGVDLPDLTVMAMAATRDAWVLTWDYRHFRSVVLRKGQYWDLLVEEAELPRP